MPSLKEIKTRIQSVEGTLKITSAMKMIASAKLHRVQATAAALASYKAVLSQIASAACSDPELAVASPLTADHKEHRAATVVAIASDSSLCGAFNHNAIRELEQTVEALRAEGFSQITVWPIGVKIAAAVRKAGYASCTDYVRLGSALDYGKSAQCAERLMASYASGETDRIVMVHNHFYSMGHQAPKHYTLMPVAVSDLAEGVETSEIAADYIFEPGAAEMLRALIPYALRIFFYEALTDSATAEHASRMIAMQTASDNASELLDELSVTYNKRRQQAITDELADITQATMN